MPADAHTGLAPAWDRLMDLIDHLTATPASALGEDIERAFAALCVEGMGDGSVDRELNPVDVGRWLGGLVAAHRVVQEAHPEVPPDDDLALMRAIVTRWLHPSRPDR